MKNITQNEAWKFWRRNLKLISILLTVWFIVSYGIVILLGDELSTVPFMGTSLPFWFGQQGTIIIFLGLLIIYAVGMNRITSSIEEAESAAIEEWLKAADAAPEPVAEEVMV